MSNIKDNNIKDPMTFMSEEQVMDEKRAMEEFNRALHFGAEALANRLKKIYNDSGIDGLNKVEKILNRVEYISRILDGSLEVDYPSYPTTEAIIVAILKGEIDPIEWPDDRDDDDHDWGDEDYDDDDEVDMD